MPVPGNRSMCTPVGAITSNAIVAAPPVTVTVCVVSGAVKMTLTPILADKVPAVLLHAALPGACVSVTCSPTPMSVRFRAPGAVATVSLVIVSGGAGAGPGGAGAVTGGAGAGPGGAGAGPGGAGAGAGGAGKGPGAAKKASRAPIVSGPTIPSGFNPCDRW